MNSPHATPALTAFEYLTSGEALNREHPVYVSDIPEELPWGMSPLGWRYCGHANLLLGEHDLWTPPEHANPTLANYLSGSAVPTHQLAVPRERGAGQYEIRFGYIPPDSTRFARIQQVTLWRASITTRSELNTQLLMLHEIACDPDVLAAYTALQIRR
jgi:hypothetical protein